jgi:hypothetical protein
MSSHKKRDVPGIAAAASPEECSGIYTAGATRSAMDGMVHCLSKDRVICKYAVFFGDNHYCRHPNNMGKTA